MVKNDVGGGREEGWRREEVGGRGGGEGYCRFLL